MKISMKFQRDGKDENSLLIDLYFTECTDDEFLDWLDENEDRLEKINPNYESSCPENIVRIYGQNESKS
jgi:hypothetical protein